MKQFIYTAADVEELRLLLRAWLDRGHRHDCNYLRLEGLYNKGYCGGGEEDVDCDCEVRRTREALAELD
jgi:hypothetical protein